MISKKAMGCSCSIGPAWMFHLADSVGGVIDGSCDDLLI